MNNNNTDDKNEININNTNNNDIDNMYNFDIVYAWKEK